MESKDKKEKINKDGSITLTSQDGKYSVTYRTNENGKFFRRVGRFQQRLYRV